ncbi:MAG: isocitrate/isopropylmalate family dehydrogenase [Myxococcota bacterium]
MSYEVTLVPGDGIGPQVADVMRDVVAALGVDVAWDVPAAGDLEAIIASSKRTGVVVKGKIVSRAVGGKMPLTLQFRKRLGVHAIVRHVKHLEGLPARAPGTDIVVVREASEDIYSGFEHESTDGVFESVKVTTRAACERIATFAFEWAVRNGRKKVTTVHKANILKKADGMFLNVSKQVAALYPSIQHDDIIVDALCMRLVRRPSDFDVLLCGNLFGDIVSDCAAGMAGGVTVACGTCYAPGVVVFENPHGTTVEVVGPDGANPYPMLGMAADLLGHLGEVDASRRLRGAIVTSLTSGLTTLDMGGSAHTSQIHQAIKAAIKA